MMTLHFTVDPSAQAHGTDAAPPAAPTDLASCPAPSEKIFFFLFFRNHVLISPSRLDWRGVSRSSRTWKRDAVDVSGCSALVARTNNPGRTAKSYGPDIPVLMSSRRAVSTNAPTTGAKKPVPEESTYKPFKHCAGRPVIWLILWFCRVLFCCTRTMGISGYPAFPAPSLSKRVTCSQNSGCPCRENAPERLRFDGVERTRPDAPF